MQVSNATKLRDLVSSLIGLPCWYISGGGSAGSSFEMALGTKIPRDVHIKNPALHDDFRAFEGEANLLVWCSWRLDDPTAPLVSSDDESTDLMGGPISRLVGARVRAVTLFPPAWDLHLIFDNHLTLKIFCDHVGPDASFDGNWELFCREITACVGRGGKLDFEQRSEAVDPAIAH